MLVVTGIGTTAVPWLDDCLREERLGVICNAAVGMPV